MSSRAVLLLLSVVLAIRIECVEANAGFCLQSIPPADDTDFKRASRSIPAKSPALAAHDWDISQMANQEQLVTSYVPCHAAAPIFRYKVAKGVIYVDQNHASDAYKPYRDGFMEQLVLAMWFYSGFPDVDLAVDYTDHPQLCDQAIPFLRFSIFNISALGAAQAYNTTELLAPAWVTPEYVSNLARQNPSGALPYTRGFTIPSPEAWRHLSLTPQQLKEYTQCLDTTHPWESKRHIVFWRGQATGCSRGWPLHQAHSVKSASSEARFLLGPGPHLLANKRIQMVLRAFPHPGIFDAGITSLPRFTPECLGTDAGQLYGRRAFLLEDLNECGSNDCDAAEAAHQHASQAATAAEHGGNGESHPQQRKVGKPRGSDSLLKRDLAENEAVEQGSEADGGTNGQQGSHAVNSAVLARAFRAVGYLLHKEGVGMEGWADAVATLSVDGYGPAYRLPQQLLLGSVVLKMASPYQTWLDWHLVPGEHYEQFAYDLSDLEHKGISLFADEPGAAAAAAGSSSPVVGNSRLKGMAHAARSAVAEKVDIFAQLDAFAWSIARYKEVCSWDVVVAEEGRDTWQVVQLNPAEVFNSKGVPESVQAQIMLHLRQNFRDALKHPAYAHLLKAEGG